MTEDECKALKRGDWVYYWSAFSDVSNATIETPNGLRDVRLASVEVGKVGEGVVYCNCSSFRFADLFSVADAQAAMARYAAAQHKNAAEAARVLEALDRIERAGYYARRHCAEVQVVESTIDVTRVERLADIITTGARAVDLMAEVRAACPVVDAPMVTLHLSVEQAERALAALQGATFADALRLARGCSDYGGGHSGDCYDAFQHGIATVVRVLESWAAGERSHQLCVVHGVGADAEKGGE